MAGSFYDPLRPAAVSSLALYACSNPPALASERWWEHFLNFNKYHYKDKYKDFFIKANVDFINKVIIIEHPTTTTKWVERPQRRTTSNSNRTAPQARCQ